MQFEFSRLVSKNSQISNFMKIRPVGTEMFHAGDRYDAFRNVANVSKANQLMQHEKTIIVPPPPSLYTYNTHQCTLWAERRIV